MNESDRVRLQHMLDAAREVESFIAGKSRADLDDDILLVRGLSMSIGIIGEAAARLSEELRDAEPTITWKQIIGMRNFLFHQYFRLDLNILWTTATHDVVPLIGRLEAILAASNGSAE